MKILVTGGTVFLGRHIVKAAVARGHDVTLFNRGQTNQALFPTLAKLKGDRATGDLSALAGMVWDAVIDSSAYYPRAVSDLLAAVTTKHYTLVSSISVYASHAEPNQTEAAAVLADRPETETVTGETYGPLKVLCEEAAYAALPDQTLSVRSGLIVGPDDPTDRFTYWPVRVAQGGAMLTPGSAAYPMQFVDVRDEAAWIIQAVEQSLTGNYNVTGLPISIGDVLTASRAIAQSDATFQWISATECADHDVAPWQDLPLWMPAPDFAGFSAYNIEKARAAGLTFRPLEETIRDTLTWWQSKADQTLSTGISREKEQLVLDKLTSKSESSGIPFTET